MFCVTYGDVLDFWKKAGITTADELAGIFEERSISLAYNSGKIENPNITYRDTAEIFKNGRVVSYTGDLRTLYEIDNAKAAYELFLRYIEEKHPFDEELIKALQFELTKNTYDARRLSIGERPGEYKRHDFCVGPDETGASAEETPDEMSELLQDIAESEPKLHAENVLTAAAFFHVKFENIHPFADGNGRAGRLAMNYLLVTHGHPPVVIYEDEKNAYYDALQAWTDRQELRPMSDFLKKQTVRTWEKALSREKP